MKREAPAFTPPTIAVSTPVTGPSTLATVKVVDGTWRQYFAVDADPETATTRAIEEALHREYARLEQQRAVVRRLKAMWRARRTGG